MTATDAAMADAGRKILHKRLVEDLIGPRDPEELLAELPSDRYLTGILFCKGSAVAGEEDEELSSGLESPEDGSGCAQEGVRLSATLRPSTMGLSFSVEAPQGSEPRLDIAISCGVYKPHHDPEQDPDHPVDSSPPNDPDVINRLVDGVAPRGLTTLWRRSPINTHLDGIPIPARRGPLDTNSCLPCGLELHAWRQRNAVGHLITLALVNNRVGGSSRADAEAAGFYQVRMQVKAADTTQLIARPAVGFSQDEDGRVGTLIYRNAAQYAGGHTCSASWRTDGNGTVEHIATEWIPSALVPTMDPGGHSIFKRLQEDADRHPLSAAWLGSASVQDLEEGLSQLPTLYRRWIELQEASIESLPDSLQAQARKQTRICTGISERIAIGIQLLASDSQACTAFQLANQAIHMARKWATGAEDLTWRPFQLAFQLLCLPSTSNAEHADRETMDLLWFPTGGGKTEAYLGLVAFLLFYRRLRHDDPARGAGTAALMRYTLRALTIQQFQRAASLICACEVLRRQRDDLSLGNDPFSIGLWVGGGATPNTVKDALRPDSGTGCTHKQLPGCPCCAGPLSWEPDNGKTTIHVRCHTKECELSAGGIPLPVHTVDEVIYDNRSSLIIGTVDKFAQIVRKEETGQFFALDGEHDPPDLILQDELHLISGPLGTLTGLYEIAVDTLCSRDGRRPKVIGSTATIRRAPDQIRSLFDRDTCQFPPPCLDHDDSCFAVVDNSAPGRLYVGVTTAGRSPKFTLQAVSASLLQSAIDPGIPATQRDHYWTLLAYFNSLRELGGALVLMQDDVNVSVQAYARRHDEDKRQLTVPEELTSRKTAADIRDILGQLNKTAGEDAYDVLLATNMISVGVDIPRLGLMEVNGQPKTIAEYIQATSRVGRGRVPGLIVGLFNNNKSRDRSHYETFASWHQCIYRGVEATSVTPFASRAIDKALHAVVVALVRHLLPELGDAPRLTPANRKKAEHLCDAIRDRVRKIDPSEADNVERSIRAFLDDWESQPDLERWWDDHGKKPALLMSAEQSAAIRASQIGSVHAHATPNSMRDVEPATLFRMRLHRNPKKDDQTQSAR